MGGDEEWVAPRRGKESLAPPTKVDARRAAEMTEVILISR
jgi:hypothetical protein